MAVRMFYMLSSMTVFVTLSFALSWEGGVVCKVMGLQHIVIIEAGDYFIRLVS